MTITLLDRKPGLAMYSIDKLPIFYMEYTVRVHTGDRERIFYVYRNCHNDFFDVFDETWFRNQFTTRGWSKTVATAFRKRTNVIRCYREEYQRRFGDISDQDLQVIQEICTE